MKCQSFRFLILLFVSFLQIALYASKISSITQSIQHILSSTVEPSYQLLKISYANLSKSNYRPCQNLDPQNNRYELIPSINIHEGDSISYPTIIRYCNDYFTVNGKKIIGFPYLMEYSAISSKYEYFWSSTKNQFTYFAQVSWGIQKYQFTKVIISRLHTKNRKVNIQHFLSIEIPSGFGVITSFVNSFSLSLKQFAFATAEGNILFYKQDGKLESFFNILQKANITRKQRVRLVKLNNYLAIYTQNNNENSFVYTIHTNGKVNTLKKYMLPVRETFKPNDQITLKFNDNNWNQFYLKLGSRVYIYYLTSNSQNSMTQPKSWYPLVTEADDFFVLGNMLLISSVNQVRFYYNLTTGKPALLGLPPKFCEGNEFIGTSSQTLGSHILCKFCSDSYQCYSIPGTNAGSSGKVDYSDYSKFRIPLIVVSFGVVIFIGIGKAKKKKEGAEQNKDEQKFLKQLKIKDRSLYEELQKSRARQGFGEKEGTTQKNKEL